MLHALKQAIADFHIQPSMLTTWSRVALARDGRSFGGNRMLYFHFRWTQLGVLCIFTPIFLVEWLQGVITTMCRHAGVVGYRPGMGAYFPPEHYYHWIDCHCELRHIHVNHCLDTVKESQRWKMGFYAAVDGINDELVLFAMHNVWFFSNEWCVKDARMVDHLGTLSKPYTGSICRWMK